MRAAILALTAVLAAQVRAGDLFFETCARRAAEAEQAGKMAVQGLDGWMFLDAELRHCGAGRFWGEAAAAVSRATKPEHADPFPAIVDFDRQLKAAGIELLLVPVPPKAAVYPEKLDAGLASDARPDSIHREFYDQLASNGVKVVDLLPAFLEAKGDGPPLYCRQDSHWSGPAMDLAAGLLASKIKAGEWFKPRPSIETTMERRPVTLAGDLWTSLGDAAIPREEIELTFIRGADGSPVGTDEESPVLLLGDSHTLIFHTGGDMQAAGAGLADLLARKLGMKLDLIGVRGSGATPSRINLARKSRAAPGYLAGKKLVIWCFASREFSESGGWRKIPLDL